MKNKKNEEFNVISQETNFTYFDQIWEIHKIFIPATYNTF